MKPNLENYEKTRRTFKWKNAEKELTWFGKKINAAYNAIDRHVETWVKNKVALYWIGEKERKEFSFLDMHLLSNKFANVLKDLDVKKGGRVFLFLPRVPEVAISFLGVLKTGAIAGTLFAAFGYQALKDRLGNSGAKIVVTNKELAKRLPKNLGLKYIILIDSEKERGKYISYKKRMEKADDEFKTKQMNPDDPAFMLYTSGTTGKPKGIVHRHLAILQEHMTAKWVLDIHPEDVYWCTADPGWVTGIAYEFLGAWSNKSSTIMYEGRFDPKKWYSILESYKVNVWYTAPTAIRMLMKAGEVLPKRYDLSSLRHICSVGEPLNPEAVKWGKKVFGLWIRDTWWQTETGGIMVANYRCMKVKPGSMGKPVPGIRAGIVDDKGRELKTGMQGNLAFKPSWPSMFKTVWKNRKKYNEYFKKGWYISGDVAMKDKDGYFWFISRADDVIKTSGERVGPFEVESALIEHPAIVEAGVIGKPDPLRGEIIKAFVILAKGYKPSKKLEQDIQRFVKKHLAGHAYPREIAFVSSLPKTRSGKIARRVLKAQEMGLPVGDTSTIEQY